VLAEAPSGDDDEPVQRQGRPLRAASELGEANDQSGFAVQDVLNSSRPIPASWEWGDRKASRDFTAFVISLAMAPASAGKAHAQGGFERALVNAGLSAGDDTK
jgi:hypothetical protein